MAAIGRYKPGNHTIEAFYLDKDDLPEANSSSKLSGVNYEYAFGEDTTLGVTYMDWSANPAERPERDGLTVYDLRAFTAPFGGLRGCRSSSSTRSKTTGCCSTPRRGTCWALIKSRAAGGRSSRTVTPFSKATIR